MHLCFIVENSLTMLQKASNSELNFFDQIKHSLETILKNVFRTQNWTDGKDPNDVIHLFVTSSTEPVSSFVDNHEIHLIQQTRDIQCTIPTFPAEVIESALRHVGKFKCLNQTETCLGYREGNVSEPAFIFYITDNSSARQIQKINQKVIENKLHLRAEYKFITIKYCGPSQNEASLNNREKFKLFIQGQKESLMMEEVMRKINGKLLYAYSSEQLVNSIQNILFRGIDTISMGLSNKQYRIYNKQIVSLLFNSQAAQEKYFQRLKYFKKLNAMTKNPEQSSIDLFVDSIPIQTRPSIPLPHQVIPKVLSQGKIIIDEFEHLKYFVDFTKEYVGGMGQGMRFLRNIFELTQSKELLGLFQDFQHEKKFPLFYEKQKIQYLIGFLRVYLKQPQNPASRTCQLHISFSNFTNLNATIRSYFERNSSSEQYFQNYISTLPTFYHKTLKFLLSYSNIILSPLTERCFENIHIKPIGVTNMKLYEQRLAEKQQLAVLRKESIDKHNFKKSKCCAIYSDRLEQFYLQKSQFYSGIRGAKQSESELSKFFQQSIKNLIHLQPNTFVFDNLTQRQIKSSSMTQQIKKYPTFRRSEIQIDNLFGNPFKKVNKKVKLDVEAESVWVEPQEVGIMKELLNKEVEVASQMKPQFLAHQIVQMEKIMKMESIYDKLAGIKGIITDVANRVENIGKAVNEVKEKKGDGLKSNKDDLQDKTSTNDPQQNKKKNLQIIKQDRDQEEKIIEQEQGQHEISTEQLNEEQQRLMCDWIDEKAQKDENSIIENQPNKKPPGQNQKMTEKNSESSPQIIEDVNSRFSMVKSVVLEIPTHLIHNDLYTRNKAIINDTLLAYLGLSQGSK